MHTTRARMMALVVVVLAGFCLAGLALATVKPAVFATIGFLPLAHQRLVSLLS